jgi:DNA-binding transcriptional LysR family regulator
MVFGLLDNVAPAEPSPELDEIASMAVFAAVVERGSFTAAARALGIAKSVASARVARLEAHLGARLLYRTTRRVVLTPAGAELYPACARVAAAAGEVRRVATEAGALRGRLRVNAPVWFGQRWLAAPLVRFQERHPGVDIDMVLDDARVDVVGGGWDAVVRLGPVGDPELVARRFALDTLVLVASPAYLARAGNPSHPVELTAHRRLRYAHADPERGVTFAGPDGEFAVPMTGSLAASDSTLLRALAEEGAGVIVAPWSLVGEALATGRLARLLPDYRIGDVPCQVVHAHGPHPPARLRVFVDHLVAHFRVPPWGAPA